MDNLKLLPDKELQRLAYEGNEAARDELAARYIYLPRAIVRRSDLFMYGGDYDDLIQEGTIGLLSAIKTFNPDADASFITHVYNCIERRLISAVRAAARKKHGPLNNGISIEELSDSPDENMIFADSRYSLDPEKIIIAQENSSVLEKELENILSAAEYKVIRLYLDGKTYREIAEELGKDVKFVDNAVQRIRKKLMRAINSGEISIY